MIWPNNLLFIRNGDGELLYFIQKINEYLKQKANSSL